MSYEQVVERGREAAGSCAFVTSDLRRTLVSGVIALELEVVEEHSWANEIAELSVWREMQAHRSACAVVAGLAPEECTALTCSLAVTRLCGWALAACCFPDLAAVEELEEFYGRQMFTLAMAANCWRVLGQGVAQTATGLHEQVVLLQHEEHAGTLSAPLLRGLEARVWEVIEEGCRQREEDVLAALGCTVARGGKVSEELRAARGVEESDCLLVVVEARKWSAPLVGLRHTGVRVVERNGLEAVLLPRGVEQHVALPGAKTSLSAVAPEEIAIALELLGSRAGITDQELEDALSSARDVLQVSV